MILQKKIVFSIIVPVYKVENYLSDCLDSLLLQDFDQYEIILVDDGSPDACPQICDKYANAYSNVSVIHKLNGGSSSARNVGLENAIGEYIVFVDSDDFWEGNDNLKNLQNRILLNGEVDVVFFNNVDLSMISGQRVVINRNYDVNFIEHGDRTGVLQYLFNNGIFPGAAWVTVTRREFLLDNGIRFIEGIKAEDVDWLLNVCLKANHFSAINDSFYVYRKYRNDSITGTANTKSIDDLLYTIDLWEERLNSNEYSYIKDSVLGYLVTHYLSALLIYSGITSEEKRKYRQRLFDEKPIMKYSQSVIVRLCSYLPIEILCLLLRMFRILRKR